MHVVLYENNLSNMCAFVLLCELYCSKDENGDDASSKHQPEI